MAFELSIANPDKPMLSSEEVFSRLERFKTKPVLVTRAPLFLDKARMFPHSMFVIGADTAARIVNDKYYPPGEMIAVMTEMIQAHGVRFVVSGRLNDKTGRFETGEDEVRRALPPSLVTKAFIFLQETDFRVDMSSTEIRKRLKI